MIFPAFLSNREDINSAISCLVYYLRSQILLKCPTWKLRLARHVQDAARAKSGWRNFLILFLLFPGTSASSISVSFFLVIISPPGAAASLKSFPAFTFAAFAIVVIVYVIDILSLILALVTWNQSDQIPILFFNNWSQPPIKICPKACIICQSKCNILPNAK